MGRRKKNQVKPKESAQAAGGGALDRLRQFELERGLPPSPRSPNEDVSDDGRRDPDRDPPAR
jgi:hypothetical protein